MLVSSDENPNLSGQSTRRRRIKDIHEEIREEFSNKELYDKIYDIICYELCGEVRLITSELSEIMNRLCNGTQEDIKNSVKYELYKYTEDRSKRQRDYVNAITETYKTISINKRPEAVNINHYFTKFEIERMKTYFKNVNNLIATLDEIHEDIKETLYFEWENECPYDDYRDDNGRDEYGNVINPGYLDPDDPYHYFHE